MAERRAGLGRGLGELFQRTDVDAPLNPVDEHVIVDKLGRQKAGVAGSTAQQSAAGSPASELPGLDVSRGTRAAKKPLTGGNDGVRDGLDAIPDAPHAPAGTTQAVGDRPGAATDEPAALEVSPRRGTAADDGTPAVDPSNGYFTELPIDHVHPNAKQPRTIFEDEALGELVGSIREVGLLQPIVVRQDGPESYELVMGERRWRASRQAGLDTVPAIVRATADDDMLRDALLENIHRVQLNPLEEAAAYQQLMEDFGCTQQELADRIKRSRSQIANTLRLLNLPPTVQRRVAAGVLSAGHARALLGLPDVLAQESLAQRIVAEGLSVRATEEIVALGATDRPKPRQRGLRGNDPHLHQVSAELENYFETRVQVTQGRTKGKIVVEFASKDDLDRIMELLRR